MSNRRISTEKMTLGAVLTALVIILQFAGAFIRLGQFQVSLVLIPIVIGAATCGIGISAWLGFVFGAIVLLNGDAAFFLGINPFGTVVTVLLKGILAGLITAVCYKLLSKVNNTLAVFVSAAVCPIVNTGVFVLGCLVFFMPSIKEWAVSEGVNAFKYIFAFLIGGNFIFEFITNMILSPVLVRLLSLRKKA